MKILSRILKLLFIFTPLITFAVIYFFPETWKTLYPKESLSIIYTQIEYLYSSNPFALITLIGALFGLISYYYGTLINSENKNSKVSENIENRLKAIAFFTVIPSFILFGYFLINIDRLFTISGFLIVYYFLIIIVHQMYIGFENLKTLHNHYDYDVLLKTIQNPRNLLSEFIDSLQKKKNEKNIFSPSQSLFHLCWLFFYVFILLKTQISTILILFLFWLVFVSTTTIAVYYSIATARYFLVDITLEKEEYKEAIFIREEKDDFIRIVPKPIEDKSKQQYRGILVNKNHILSINYHFPIEKKLETYNDSKKPEPECNSESAQSRD